MTISAAPIAVILARGLGTRLRAASQVALDAGAAAGVLTAMAGGTPFNFASGDQFSVDVRFRRQM